MDHSRANSNGYYGDNQAADHNAKTPSKEENFDEYMWMENEEEAEKEMLQEIHEEQLAQQLYSEIVDEDAWRSQHQHQQPPNANLSQAGQEAVVRQQWSAGCRPGSEAPPAPAACSGYTPSATSAEDLANNLRTMSVNDKPKVALNPMAAEFVPGQSVQSSFQPGSG